MAEYLKPDLCIIGGGAAGLAAAETARQLGASVMLIDRNRIGGDLGAGSLPSKALAAAAAHAQALRQASRFGMGNDEPKPNFKAVQAQVQKVVEAAAPDSSPERLAALGLQVIIAEAKFVDRRTLQAGDILVRARRYIIATGSAPAIPTIPGLDDIDYFTTDSIFTNARKLTHLLIIGGGPAGIELAQAHRRFGSAVTIIEAQTILGRSDPELAEIVMRQLRDEGIEVRDHTQVAEVMPRSQGIGIRIVGTGGESEILDVSHVLVTTGRLADLAALEPGRARLSYSRAEPGRLLLNKVYRTSNRRVYAVGDAAAAHQQVPSGRHQARIAIRHALLGTGAGGAPLPLTALYADPELAETGMTEPQARARYKNKYRVARVPFAQNDRARALQRSYGVAKLICHADGRILGAGIAGPQAGELIGILTLAIAHKLKARDLANFVAPYPSLADIVRQLGVEIDAGRPLSGWTRLQLAVRRQLS